MRYTNKDIEESLAVSDMIKSMHRNCMDFFMENIIYKIECLANGMKYIGVSMTYKRRFKQHLIRLKKGIHPCCKMQDDYNKYGKDMFTLSVIGMGDSVRMEDDELVIIKQFNPSTLYNKNIGQSNRKERREKKLNEALCKIGCKKGNTAHNKSKNILRKIIRERKKQRMTISELSNISKVSPSAIYCIENGTRIPSQTTITKLCNALYIE